MIKIVTLAIVLGLLGVSFAYTANSVLVSQNLILNVIEK